MFILSASLGEISGKPGWLAEGLRIVSGSATYSLAGRSTLNSDANVKTVDCG